MLGPLQKTALMCACANVLQRVSSEPIRRELSEPTRVDILLLQAVVSKASLSNPGVPPGFLRAKPSLAAAALTDFDTTYSNRFYGNRCDNGSNADAGSISAAVAVVARALHALALGPDAAPLQVLLIQCQLAAAWVPMVAFYTVDVCRHTSLSLRGLPVCQSLEGVATYQMPVHGPICSV
jgi:hypothetical protein